MEVKWVWQAREEMSLWYQPGGEEQQMYTEKVRNHLTWLKERNP